MKRATLIDDLLQREEYSMYWGMKFSDWTGNSKYISRNPQQWNWVWQQWTWKCDATVLACLVESMDEQSVFLGCLSIEGQAPLGAW